MRETRAQPACTQERDGDEKHAASFEARVCACAACNSDSIPAFFLTLFTRTPNVTLVVTVTNAVQAVLKFLIFCLFRFE
jgi:hypothetical protein